MVPAPLRPLQNALVVLATFLVAGALLPWSSRLRLACAGAVIAIVCVLLVWRLRAHAAGVTSVPVSATQARVERIRAARKRRAGWRR